MFKFNVKCLSMFNEQNIDKPVPFLQTLTPLTSVLNYVQKYFSPPFVSSFHLSLFRLDARGKSGHLFLRDLRIIWRKFSPNCFS